ncbi:MAG: hypothetical protein KCHDKBKB_00509 [Elusimicrobia bacterium]|nr:hypothetical protein [Elusimicrobiota bacterium]
MEFIDELTLKVNQAAEQIIQLKMERHKHVSELELLRNQLKNFDSLLRENEKMKRDQDLLRTRLSRLQKKIEKHLLVETTLAAQSGGAHEERSQ